MTYALSNETADRIAVAIGMRATMAVTPGGYRVRIPTGTRANAETVERMLPEVEAYLRDHEGLQPGSRQVGEREAIVHIGATPADDVRLLSYSGRLSRVGPGRDGQMLAFLDDTIVPIDTKSPHVMLARDGDRIRLTYLRLTDGRIMVGGFTNLELPYDWRDG